MTHHPGEGPHLTLLVYESPSLTDFKELSGQELG